MAFSAIAFGLLLGGVLYLSLLLLANPAGWQIEDDEGAYLYQAWRISLGEWPYRDFLSAQQPLFIGLGGAVMALTGPSQAVLRLLSGLVTLATAAALGGSVGRVCQRREVGVAAALIFLAHPDLFRVGRFYLSEVYMLLGCVLGLGMLVHWQRTRKRWTLAGAGLLFALATLFKLFALLSWTGAVLYVIAARRGWREAALDGLALLGPALGVVLVMGGFEGLSGTYFAATIGHHLLAGAGANPGVALLGKLKLFRQFMWRYPLLVLAGGSAGVYGLLRPRFRGAWLAWQLPALLGLLLIRRELGMRHFLIFLPAFAGLSASLLATIRRAGGRLVGAAFILVLILPWLPVNLSQAARFDHWTGEVVSALKEWTAPDTVVLSDYLEINFLARRPTVPIAAGLHHTSAASGQITAKLLIQQLAEAENPWVVVDVSPLTGSTLVGVRDYPLFHFYLREHYRLKGVFQRDVQQLQVWEPLHPPPAVQLLPSPEYRSGVQVGDLAVLTGYTLEGLPAPGQPLTLTLFWEVRGLTPVGYSVFVHLQDDEGELVANWDGEPLEGLYPTWRWWPGQLVVERRVLTLPVSLEAGIYHLSAGIYDWRTGQRLPVYQVREGRRLPEDRIPLADFEVRFDGMTLMPISPPES